MAARAGAIVGIDLGTTFSAIAYLDRTGTPVTIPNAEGELITPSAILFEPDGSVVVGKHALRAASMYPDRFASCVKRDMGEAFYSHIVAGKRWKPQHLSAFILRKLRQDAETRIGPILGAVITVPAYYDELRRQATVDAGRIAGLNVIDIINEPTSAALAYAFRRVVEAGRGHEPAQNISAVSETLTGASTVMVCDLGGGTFDVTIIRQADQQVHVLATDGDLFLGGRDWDERIINHAAKLFIDQFVDDPRVDPQCTQELWRSAEEVKKDLSYRQSAMFSISHAGNQLGVSLGREQFETMTNDLLYRVESRIVRVLRNAKLSWSDIDDTLLVGGSSRMPQVRQMVKSVSGREPNSTLAFDEIVAHGAVVHGAVLQAKGKIEDAMMTFAGPSAEPLPEAMPMTSTDASGPEIDTGDVHPPDAPVAPPPVRVVPTVWGARQDSMDVEDFGPNPFGVETAATGERHADGAARPPADNTTEPPMLSPAPPEPADELARVLRSFTAINVNAHSLGVIAHSDKHGHDVSSIIIARNSPLPASDTKCYGTVSDNQEFIRVRIIEGESSRPEACIAIGECIVGPPASGPAAKIASGHRVQL